MTIKQQGGIFGRNPSFNDLEVNSAATSLPVSSIDTGSNKNQVSFTAIYRV